MNGWFSWCCLKYFSVSNQWKYLKRIMFTLIFLCSTERLLACFHFLILNDWLYDIQKSIKKFPFVYKGIMFMRLFGVSFHQQPIWIFDNKFVHSVFAPFHRGIWGDFPDFQLKRSYLSSPELSKLFPFVYLINREKRILKCLSLNEKTLEWSKSIQIFIRKSSQAIR